MAAPALKVSVIVATYRSGEGLDRLIASLDAQSLPTDEWEAIFVDDGSPDDTFERLTEIARSRPHFRVTRIENSGWPCRPRNTGIDLARGEYVAFMDHDDELYPHALRDGHAYARAHGADVLNGKEARTDDAGWAIDQFPADMPQVLGQGLPYGALTPTNPHKLYRRQLLVDHDIRFREGGRVLWEDIFFNVAVLAKAEVVSTMASTPYYHWFTTAGSGSTTFRRARAEWWFWLGEVIEAIESGLDAPGLEDERRLLLEHQYRSRLMDAFNAYYVERAPETRKLIFEHAHRLQEEHFPESADDCLDTTWRLRAKLLRAGHPHALDRLIREDPVLGPVPRAEGLRWEGGRLHIGFRVEWKDGEGRRHALRTVDGRVRKVLPAPFAPLFTDDELDVTGEVEGASAAVGVRSEDTRIGWLVPSESTVWRRDDPATTTFGVEGSATVDPSTAALGAPLEGRIWDLSVRSVLGTMRRQPMLRGAVEPAVSLTPAGVRAAYAVGGDRIVLDLDPQDLGALVRPTGRIAVHDGRTAVEVSVDELPSEMPGIPTTVRVAGLGAPTRGRGLARLRRPRATVAWSERPAQLVVRDGRAWLEIDGSVPVDVHLGARFPGGGSVYRVTTASITPLRPR